MGFFSRLCYIRINNLFCYLNSCHTFAIWLFKAQNNSTNKQQDTDTDENLAIVAAITAQKWPPIIDMKMV